MYLPLLDLKELGGGGQQMPNPCRDLGLDRGHMAASPPDTSGILIA